MICYVKCFDSNKTMSFKVNNNKRFKYILKYGKKFDSEPVYCDNEKYIKTKIKPYGGRVITK